MYGLVIRRILIIMVPIVPSLPKEFPHISGTRIRKLYIWSYWNIVTVDGTLFDKLYYTWKRALWKSQSI